MTRAHALFLGGLAVLLASALLSFRSGGATAAQPAGGQPSAPGSPTRIATADIYAVVEKLMQRPDYKKAQEDLKAKWDPKMDAIQKDFSRIDADLQMIPQNDPKYPQVLKAGRDKQAEYDKAVQDRQVEFEGLSAKQLTESYGAVRDAASRVAERQGYTHVFANRPPERAINASTLGAALQEFLARPLIKSPPGDDLTRAVAAEMKIDL
jgi:Skp family chaperone for outer membrane proteins